MESIKDFQPIPSNDDQFPSSFIQQCGALILKSNSERHIVGLTRTSDMALQWEIQRYFRVARNDNREAEFVDIDNGELASLIHQQAGNKFTGFESDQADASDEALDRLANNAPIVNLVNSIILDAIREKASDIHIERQKVKAVVRFRLDGILSIFRELPANIFPSIATRVKIMSGLNILESRRPQDGRLSVTLSGTPLDIRVSVVPTAHGESLVLRILNLQSAPRSLDAIGFSGDQLDRLIRAGSATQGMILFTGPTGSGKSTTLSALINHLNDGKKKIITIEDPVEFEIEGVDQIHTHDEIGLSFSRILRRILRQDPDIIMVGEIRDEETAQLCIRAAMTGHLVLSSLHTNTAISTIQRLLDMQIKPFLLSSVLKMVTAQRLVRTLCPHCKIPADDSTRERFIDAYRAHAHMHDDIDGDTVEIFSASPSGCNECSNRGYRGRTVITEMIPVDEQLAELIDSQAEQKEFIAYLRSINFSTLSADALQKVAQGITSFEEVSDLILVNT